jgi:hypothetical protein
MSKRERAMRLALDMNRYARHADELKFDPSFGYCPAYYFQTTGKTMQFKNTKEIRELAHKIAANAGRKN